MKKDYRQLYKKYYGIEFGAQYDIHHIDENRNNNNISNLLLLPHNTHENLHLLLIDHDRYSDYDFREFIYSKNLELIRLELYAQTLQELSYWNGIKQLMDLNIKCGNQNQYLIERGL